MTIENKNHDELLNLLADGSRRYRCGIYLYHMDVMRRQQIYHELESERMEEKCYKINKLFKLCDENWNQLFFVNFLRYLSDEPNRNNYIEIGLRIGHNTLLREKGSLRNMEALLIAASGLVDTLPKDEFTKELKKSVAYMAHKYEIEPIPQECWIRRGMTPTKEPIIRLVQAARLFHKNELIFNALINCRTRDDIFNLFNIEGDSEWNKYFGESQSRKIGVMKCDLIGINFVAPMLHLYGIYTSNDDLLATAASITESIPAESNRYITGWKREGLAPISAFETQALIQLYTKHCMEKACKSCPVFRDMTSSRSALNQIPNFLEH